MIDMFKFATKYNIDKEKHPDSEVVVINGKKVSLGDVRKEYEEHHKERLYKMFTFYDDVFQYTSIGLLDIIYEMYDIKLDLPIKYFFNRNESDGREFVIKWCESFGIKREDILNIEKKYYYDILLRSPWSKHATSFLKIRSITDAHIMVFREHFDQEEAFSNKIINKYKGQYAYSSFEMDFLKDKDLSSYFKEIPKRFDKYFEIAIVPDAKILLDFLEERKIDSTTIISFDKHCGLTPDYQMIYEMFDSIGPRNTRLFYVEDGL